MRRLATRPEGPGGISISFFSKQDSIEDEGWTPHRTNRAIQPKQGPSSQVSGTFLTRDGWVRVLPREWKKNLIVLVDKATAQTWRTGNPLRWVMLSSSCFLRCWPRSSDTRWATANGRLSSAQNGFLPHKWYLEHSFVLRLMKDARQRKKEADALDSVPHAVVACVTWRVVDMKAQRYTSRRGHWPNPHALRGTTGLLLKPCPLQSDDWPPGLHGRRRRIMGSLLSAEETAKSLALTFNPRKCATLHVGLRGGPIPTTFQMTGQQLPMMDSYLHLGVPTEVPHCRATCCGFQIFRRSQGEPESSRRGRRSHGLAARLGRLAWEPSSWSMRPCRSKTPLKPWEG